MTDKIRLYDLTFGGECRMRSYAIKKPDGTWMIVTADLYPGEDVFVEAGEATAASWERKGKFVRDLEPKQVLTHEQFTERFIREQGA